MTTETILTDEQIVGILHNTPLAPMPSHHVVFARAIERAVLQSPEVKQALQDKARLDSGVIMTHERDEFGLEYMCERRGLDLRTAIDAAMEKKE